MTRLEHQAVHKKVPGWLAAAAFVVLAGFLALMYVGYARSRPEPINLGHPLPEIELTTFDHKLIRPADLQNKVVVMNFWASWCEPCEQEAAGLEKAWQSYRARGDVLFLGVDYVDTEAAAIKFLQEYGVTYPNGPDLRSVISSEFRIRGVPETYIFDQSGKLAYLKIGPFTSTAEISQIIDPLLEQE